jgi:hypothetical protein
MTGWIPQWKLYVPAVANVTDFELFVKSDTSGGCPAAAWSNTTLCGVLLDEFLNVTASPALIVIVAGLQDVAPTASTRFDGPGPLTAPPPSPHPSASVANSNIPMERMAPFLSRNVVCVCVMCHYFE